MSLTRTKIVVRHDLLSDPRAAAAEFRSTLAARGTLVVNLISSPGAGKTSLLEATARHWAGRYRMAVLVGDIATDRDAQRLAPLVPVAQLTTGGACHLEFSLVAEGLRQLDPGELDFLFIENVGNLVCPASHDLGEHLRVVLLSTTEGDDKPGKYPKAFRTSHALVINKTDLLPHVPFSVQCAASDARQIQPQLEVVATSTITNEGIERWTQYLELQRERLSASIEATTR
jgi:hydrogenase nickel incorporation protein HypB